MTVRVGAGYLELSAKPCAYQELLYRIPLSWVLLKDDVELAGMAGLPSISLKDEHDSAGMAELSSVRLKGRIGWLELPVRRRCS